MGGGVGWCKPIFVSNPQPSYFGLLLGWVAVAWLGFGVMTTSLTWTGEVHERVEAWLFLIKYFPLAQHIVIHFVEDRNNTEAVLSLVRGWICVSALHRHHCWL